MEVLIVGAGEMGRWFAGVIEDEVAFADVDPGAAEAAASDLGGRAVPLDAEERFDAVAIAVPMSAAVEAIHEHAPRSERAVLDLAGVMAGPFEAMRAYDRERASLHPLFAAQNAPGRIAVVTENAGGAIDSILSDLEAAGNELIETTPEEHDRAMETIQARVHAAVLAFGLAADDVPAGFGTPVYDRLIDLLGEVTGGTPRVYADIQAAFDGAEDVADAATEIAEADREAFEDLYREAGRLVEADGIEDGEDA